MRKRRRSQTVFTETRSRRLTSATRPDRFAKTAASGADVTILDLEDSVAPGDKDRAAPCEQRSVREGRAMTQEFVWPELHGALHMHQPWGVPGIEPPLREVLTDPLVRAVMRRDGVSLAALESLVAAVRRVVG